jgi:Leucine carboxyl methyltransferase
MENGAPSVTARRVAAHRLGFERAAADYGDPAADQALAADVAAGHVASASRMHDYLAARTAFFDRTVVAAIDRGVRQVVVGAAGYDGRAFRYAKPRPMRPRPCSPGPGGRSRPAPARRPPAETASARPACSSLSSGCPGRLRARER